MWDVRVMTKSRSKSLSLWHPFTPAAVGLPEDQVIRVHSRPQLAAMQHMATRGWRSRVEYLTAGALPYQRYEGPVEWRFWPRLPIRARGTAAYRRERSPVAVLSLLAAPPDVLVINISGQGSRLARALGRICEARSRRYIAMIGGVHLSLTAENVRYFREASAIIVHTRAQKTQLERLPEFVGARLGVMPLGVNLERFQPAPHRARERIGDPGLLYAGRWLAWKGLARAVEAFAQVKQAYPNAQFHIVGPQSDAAYVAQVRRQITMYGLDDAVHIHDTLPQDALIPWYQGADFLMLVSDPGEESFGMVAVESMACGTPVVALKAEGGGPAAIITHGVDGLLVDQDNIGAAIIDLYANETHYNQMRDAARHKVATQYSEAVTAQAFEDIIEGSA